MQGINKQTIILAEINENKVQKRQKLFLFCQHCVVTRADCSAQRMFGDYDCQTIRLFI
jgi:hypothetical protein